MQKRIIYACLNCCREFTGDVEYDSDESVEYVDCPSCHAKSALRVHPIFTWGDKVKITANSSCHGFEIGEEVTITEIYNYCDAEICYDATNGEDEWCVTESDISSAETKQPSAVDKFGSEVVKALRRKIGLAQEDSSKDYEFLSLGIEEAVGMLRNK